MKKLKVYLCLALVLCMFVSAMPASAFAESTPVQFIDIENWAADHDGKPHWASRWINYWANQISVDGKGYVVGGYSDGTYRPNSNITRGAVAAILDRIYGFESTGETFEFSDVPSTHVFYKSIMACADNGVIMGYGDAANTFRPANNITRQSAIAMIARCIMTAGDYKEFSSTVRNRVYLSTLWSDYSSIPESYYPEFCYLAKYGNLDGYADGTVRPGRSITRAEFVKILYSAIHDDPNVYKLHVTIVDSLGNSVAGNALYLTSESNFLESIVPLLAANREELGEKFPSPAMRALFDEGVAIVKDGIKNNWTLPYLTKWYDYVGDYYQDILGENSAKNIFSNVNSTISDMTVGKNYVMTARDTYEGRTDILYTVVISAEIMT